jgi:hypothetical protein
MGYQMLSKDELEQIAKEFGLAPVLKPDQIQISDGVISVYQNVWWKSSNGPVIVSLSDSNHLQNAKNYPNAYAIHEPKVFCSYTKPEGLTWVLG